MIINHQFIILLPLLLIVAIWERYRRQSPGDFLEHARALVDSNLPLVAGLWGASRSLTGRSRRTMRDVCTMLEIGVPLDYAAQRAFGRGMPTLEVNLLAVGQRHGTLGRTLRAICRHRGRQTVSGGLTVALTYLIALGIISGGWLTFILSGFEKLSSDFGVESQPAWAWSIISSGALALLRPISFITIVAVLVALFFPRRRADDPRLITVLRDYLSWWAPVFGTETRWRQWAVALDAWAMLTHAGLDAHRALWELAQMDLNSVLRRRLRRWAERLADGCAVEQCPEFRQAPRMAQWFIRSGLHSGDLAGALDQSADYCRGQHSRAAAVARGVLFAAVVVAIASVVVVVVVVTFGTYAALLESSVGLNAGKR